MDYKKILGNNLRSLRRKYNLTQEEVAELCNLHRTYIGAIERGNRNVSINNIVKIADIFEVSPAYLLTKNSGETMNSTLEDIIKPISD